MGFVRRQDQYLENRKVQGRTLCGVQHKDRKRAKDWEQLSGLRESIDQLAMTSNAHYYYSYMLRKEDGHVHCGH